MFQAFGLELLTASFQAVGLALLTALFQAVGLALLMAVGDGIVCWRKLAQGLVAAGI